VENGELEAVVLEEPHLGVDVELETVRRGGEVAAALVALGDAVPEHEETAGFVRRFCARVFL
jgi:hypothetical protein